MDPSHTRALEALQPFILLANSPNASSPRFVANIITNATSSPHTYVFSELLETPAVQALGSPDAPKEYQGYLKLLEIFTWDTWQEYQDTAGLPTLNGEQTLKLRLLSLVTLSTAQKPLTYQSLMSALSISTPSELESLVIIAIYSSLITARLSPATNPPTVNVTSIAPLRDVRPQTVPAMISMLSEWEGRCGQAANEIEVEIAKVKARAAKHREQERDHIARLERSIAGREVDDDVLGLDFQARRPTGGNSKFPRLKDGAGSGVGAAPVGGVSIKLGSISGGNSNKREYSADDPEEDDGYWDNGSDGGVDATGYGPRMDIDEAPGVSSSLGRATGGGASTRQAKRILNKVKKSSL